jgi:hypothetical protein
MNEKLKKIPEYPSSTTSAKLLPWRRKSSITAINTTVRGGNFMEVLLLRIFNRKI